MNNQKQNFHLIQTQKTENSSAFVGSDSRQDFSTSLTQQEMQQVEIIEQEDVIVNNIAVKTVVSPSEGSVSFFINLCVFDDVTEKVTDYRIRSVSVSTKSQTSISILMVIMRTTNVRYPSCIVVTRHTI